MANRSLHRVPSIVLARHGGNPPAVFVAPAACPPFLSRVSLALSEANVPALFVFLGGLCARLRQAGLFGTALPPFSFEVLAHA